MGGMLTLVIAAKEGDRVGDSAPFHGAPHGDGGPDFSNMSAKVVGHFAETDDFFPPEAVKAMEADLLAKGKNVSFTGYPGSGHAFTNGDDSPDTYDTDLDASTWKTTLELFGEAL